jgi:uncharacterized protein (UPF0261 family)
MVAANPTVAVLVTMDTKADEAAFVADCLTRAGAQPWIVDLSMKPHARSGADVSGEAVARAAGSDWAALAELDRRGAAEKMMEGGIAVVRARHEAGDLCGAIGLGGANGTTLACAIMRALPYLVPKAMVSTVASTAAVQWYVGESDIAMYPSIGDVTLNRITRAAIENAAYGVGAAAVNHAARRGARADQPPLVGVSSFGGTAGCVDRVVARLEELGYETILFHASGMGGRALERLAREGELAGVVDVTTHELTDFVVDGVYSAGGERLTGAGAMGLPQIVVPGATDHSNFWAGQVPAPFHGREFFRFNAQNLLMRTNAEEFDALGRAVAERLNAAKGPFRVLIPSLGYSEHTKRCTQDMDENEIGDWNQPDTDGTFVTSLSAHLAADAIEILPLHINDPAFADACVDAFLEISGARKG